MTSALFTFTQRGKYKDSKGQIKEFANVNYLNPMHIISAYWSETESGARLLNVFTTGASADPSGGIRPGRTFTFPEKQGQALINHLEDFLRLNFVGSLAPAEQQHTQRREPRRDEHRGRRPMEILDVEIDDISEEAVVEGAVFE